MSKKLLPIPLILLIPILLLVVVIVAAVYRFNMTDEEIHAKQGFSHKKEQVAGDDPVMLKLFALHNAQPWRVQVPNSISNAQLSQFIGEAPFQQVKGFYTVDGQRGEVALDYIGIQPLNLGDPDSEMVFVVPYAINKQGGNSLHYLGLFRLLHKEKKVEHLDYVFIGDNLKELKAEVDHPFDVSEAVLAKYIAGDANSEVVEKQIKVKPTRFVKE
ncbi:hypothetical protein TUMSATVNIG1_55280 [Vibrio nigripulchritudo]|uniref:hypothetical protein n=1 Tax=Vibrio nigripulchritudo TaxID=28173 RepID=UPI00190BEEE9|nr:hypothetical protein [Vibrio nigripulchritudo]BCL73551.1 hypothetical protein VNTUMSATTG_54880 [Vibrio nigripulchritudo]BDU34919.1 hypothetical protein TUMSATVNIG1_55280 [Vibrio nigripulchritudo]